ncbi:MAG: DUF4397 domain-containing protein [Flavobacteriales bacterium]|nr:hypothetical protein [Flavobacteriales bacterium]MCC6576408.1 DUF4397 domain-containing protein [Flavobacteriales bacterium]NUQ15496.1 DUF4397 domain-containing protein [Flavobacteriales bacterium]
MCTRTTLLAAAIAAAAAAPAQVARLQVVHNSADTTVATVDVYMNDSLLIDGLGFRTAWGYQDVPAGMDLRFAIAPDSSTSVADTIPGLTTTINLLDSGTYLLAAQGIRSAMGYNPAPPFMWVLTAGMEVDTLGQLGFTLHHGATDAPGLDVYERGVLNAGIINGQGYGQASVPMSLPAADLVLELHAAGDPDAWMSYSLAAQNLAGQGVAVFASGFTDPAQNSGGPAFGLWMALPTGGPLVALQPFQAPTARLQAIHASADTALDVVDLYLNDELLADDLAFRHATAFADVPAGVALRLALAPATSTGVADTIPGLSTLLQLDSAGTYVLAAHGIASGNGFNPAPPFSFGSFDPAREAALSAGHTDVLWMNACTDLPVLDLMEVGALDSLLMDDLTYPGFAGYLELPADSFTVQVRTADNSAVVGAYQLIPAALDVVDSAITVVACGFRDPAQNSNGPAFGLWAALPAGGPLLELPAAPVPMARVQIIHNSADAALATVDLWKNDIMLADDLPFRQATPFLDLQAGVDIDLGVAPAGSTSAADAFHHTVMTFAGGSTHVLMAAGIESSSGYDPAVPFGLHHHANARETATSGASNTDILVAHGGTDVPTVNINEVLAFGGVTLVTGLSYGEFTGYLEPPTAGYAFDVVAAGDLLGSFQAPLATMGWQGEAITVVVSGFRDPAQNSNGPAFGLWVADADGGPLVELPVYTGVEEQAGPLAGTVLWPNPAADRLNIRIPDLGPRSLQLALLDASGRAVRSWSGAGPARQADQLTLDLAGLAPGTYVIRLRSDHYSVALPVGVAR